ncbi:MAG: DUF1501 domain-containing protein [Chloroflexi bacterium]|nr:DUF1501 domain-containing protein [Chloroflexota bacterium]
MTTQIHCSEYGRVSRRSFLTGGLTSAAALMLGSQSVAWPQWVPRIALADPHVGPAGDTLVCIFLRGGADGLNMVVPYGDDVYYQRRPYLGIPRPDDNNAKDGRVGDLDGFFGLHPALSPLHEIYSAGDIAFIQATGSPDETHSHFEAMDLMERGATTNGDYTGWLARHLATLDTGNESALRAIGVGEMLPASLTGAVNSTALQSIADYHLRGQDERMGEMTAVLQTLYNPEQDLLTAAAQQTFAAIDVLGQIETDGAVNGRGYAENEFGQAMKLVAQLIKAEVGVEVACVDLGGWDTHVAQGGIEGVQARLMAELAAGLAALYEDIQAQIGRVTVVIMSEFGRRVQENGGLGTDHGHGGMMMTLGGGINGGQVFANWPGLQPEQLVGPGDLAITTDYRDVLGELLRKRLNNPQLPAIFPGYTVNEIGLAAP